MSDTPPPSEESKALRLAMLHAELDALLRLLIDKNCYGTSGVVLRGPDAKIEVFLRFTVPPPDIDGMELAGAAGG